MGPTLVAPLKRTRQHSVSAGSHVSGDEDGDGDEDVSASDAGPSRSPSPTTSSSAKHRCDMCPKTFTRHEHMLRHRASHTNSASFACPDCRKHFRRSDVLQRHRKLHAVRNDLALNIDTATLTKRQRSAFNRVEAACLPCSSKKLKCDAAKPSCSRCLGKPGTLCAYPASSEPRSISPSDRNRSASITNDAAMLETGDMDLSFQSFSPVSTSTGGPAQSNDIDASTLLQSESLMNTAAPLAALNTSHEVSAHPLRYLDQPSRFAAPTADPLLQPSPSFSTTISPLPHRHQPAASIHSHHQVLGATPSLLPTAQTCTSVLDPVLVTSEPSLADLLSWLDGPLAPQHAARSQSDWVVADSPEAPQLLDWSQMQDWASFDAVAHASGSLLADITPATSIDPSFQQQQQQAQHPPPQQQHQDISTSHRRTGSARHPIHHASPLFVLSSAVEMLEDTPQVAPPASVRFPPLATSVSPSAGSESPRQSPGHGRASGSAESRAVAGSRSRWNSPDPAEEEAASSDSAKSGQNDAKHKNLPSRSGMEPRDGMEAQFDPALHSKPYSRRSAAAIGAWPNRWNPSIKENSLPAFTFAKASEEHLMSEDMAHVRSVSDIGRLRMIERLRNAASNPLEQDRFDASFDTLDAATLNLYLQLFFHHCYSYLPAIHQATFDPDRCDPRLLAALCSVGAFFSEVPGSRNAGIYLASLTQMSVSRATLANHANARVTSTFQAILLIYMVWRSVGVPSRQEYAEAFRGTYCTMIRRCRLLEDISPPKMAADATLDDRWMAWIAWESGRRTAWSTLVSETELSLHWSLPEAFAPDELTGKLPCDDRLWEAPTAIDWAQSAAMLAIPRGPASTPDDPLEHSTWPSNSHDPDVASVCDIVNRAAQSSPVTPSEREMVSRLSAFSRLCVGSALMLSTHHTMRMARFCTMILGNEEEARERMRNHLAAAAELLSINQARDARIDMLLHAIQLFELVSTETLQLLSCRRGVTRMHAAREQLARELNETKPWKTGAIVLHAGQMLRLAKQSTQRAPVECFHIFYAAVALQAVSLLALQRDAHGSPQQIFRIAFNGATPSTANLASYNKAQREAHGLRGAWSANFSSSTSSSTSPSSVGGATFSTVDSSITDTLPRQTRQTDGSKVTFMLESVGNLAKPMAAERVLSLASKWLQEESGVGVWLIGKSLAKILDSLASLTPKQVKAS